MGTESSGGSFQKRSIENYFPKTSKEDAKNLVREELEISYLQKALEYLMLLPSLKRESYSTDYMKSAAEKFAHATKFSDKAKYPTSAKLKAKFVEAATNYLNSLTRNAGHDQIATDSIVKLISQTEGNYLCFCATLMTMGKLGAADLDEVVGLANAVSAVLQENVEKPYRCSAVKKPTSVENSVPIKRPFAFKKPAAFQNPGGVEKSPAVSEHKTFKTLFKPSEHLPAPESVNSPLDNLTAWPKAEQRDNIAGSRTVMLQNVSSILTLNELQSLVWGGPVETFRFQPGQSTAMVKFATPEGCDNYYKATENGIQIPGGTTFVFVKRQPSLNSVNDLLKVVISQKVTRCVRALDAEEGWNEDVLLKLARGPGEKKRDVDKIVRDKTPEGRLYIEFRFGNVYQALNFKRALQDDEEWESCVLVYASDPCELYTSIHPLG
ncbi:hypothetical protein GQ43DRAFT_46914 [Delitschia confertaspora ATCC 74209]|uniref:RRM domain-containing protein n=1 Tax=Delitschia confertaspora ATCC 74209 TaxID=1513339 RepID=A0A9P4MPW2_9PLEO|nr:hypothetical protein GQ43DRAFT_46914 [Delitschia confertaspora ATCC 74209]